MPGNPVKAVCDVITGRLVQENPNAKNIIHAIAGGVNIYTNFTGMSLLQNQIVHETQMYFHVKSDKICEIFMTWHQKLHLSTLLPDD